MIKYQIWVLTGVPPTGKYAELPNVVVMNFREGKNSHEYIYWDQASLLVQVGLLDPKRFQRQERSMQRGSLSYRSKS